jgi:hypothetical protein
MSVAGCGGGGGGTNESNPPAAPTYYEDVAPILQQHCVACHSPGNIAPFALETYADARTVAAAMKAATAAGTMPPYHIDDTGDCNTYHDARVLADAEKATLAAWADQGAAEGDPKDAPPPYVPETGLEHPDAIMDPGVSYTPNIELSDDYRCFIVDPHLAEDAFLVGYQVAPGQPSEVHHIVAFTIDTPEDEATAQALDDQDPGAGYQCFGGPGTAAPRTLLGWAPGTVVTHYPAGTGLRLMANRKVVMQVHYNLAAGAKPDRTKVLLELAPSVEHEATITGVGDFNLNIPPGRSDWKESAKTPFPALPAPITVHGVFPHMHTLGRTLRVELQRDGASSCMVNVPDYSFSWQQFYFYENPLIIAAGGPGDIQIDCHYDSIGMRDTVHFGEGTGDEMCLAGFYITY